jgi:hypothetical protein
MRMPHAGPGGSGLWRLESGHTAHSQSAIGPLPPLGAWGQVRRRGPPPIRLCTALATRTTKAETVLLLDALDPIYHAIWF